MLRIFSLESGRMVCTAMDGGAHGHHELPAALWYELLQPTAEERAFVNGKAHVDVPAREDIEEIEVSSRLYHEDGAAYMSITAVAKLDHPDGPHKTPVMFILKGETLVTVRYDTIRPIENVIDRATRNGGIGLKGEQIMLSLVEALVDRLADALEQIGDAVDALSRGVFGAKVGSTSRASRSRGDDPAGRAARRPPRPRPRKPRQLHAADRLSSGVRPRPEIVVRREIAR